MEKIYSITVSSNAGTVTHSGGSGASVGNTIDQLQAENKQLRELLGKIDKA